MRKNGFIKIHRRILESGVASEDEVLGMFVRILASVNFRSGWFKGREIKPGQMAFDWRDIGERIYPGKPPAIGTIRRRMNLLVAMEAISIEAVGRRYSVLTVPNWTQYQRSGVSISDTPADTDRRSKSKKGKKGTPTLSDVLKYAKTLDRSKFHNAISCVDDFHNHYSANGWRQGKGTGRPIKIWKASFRGWVQRQKEFNGKSEPEPVTTRFNPKDAI